MATSNRVFVSPGIYTSETELTYVSQSVGVTTLGMAGETLKGPAFEPILVGSYDEFTNYFGGASPAKYGNGNPAYELPYFAKSYLQQSNQLFVTRVLGLTGYKPGLSWVIKSLSSDSNYNGVAVAVIRSRGSYSGASLSLQVNVASGVTLSDVSGIASNPYADFNLTVGSKVFTCNFDGGSKKFISKVLGKTPLDKDQSTFPIYVHEEYSNWLGNAYNLGKVSGLTATLVSQDEGSNFITSWQTAQTPWVVSEVRGNKVDRLFRFITISDGEAANREVKISIANLDLSTLEFDVLVRAYEDTDAAPAVLERYTRCSMNPSLPGFIGKKIGTNDGTYGLVSSYIMVELHTGAPADGVPSGFEGYPAKVVNTGTTIGSIIYKTKYFKAGDLTSVTSGGVSLYSNGDKIRKSYLGISSTITVDDSLLKFKGETATGMTKGFHLSVNASGITDSNGKIEFYTTAMDLENGTMDFSDVSARKFTLTFFGGFDGWDIYRTERTNTDAFIFGKATYTGGTTSVGGVFDANVGNSDYYAYQQGIYTFNNPEAININVLATPGINFYDHTLLTQDAIDMVEIDRADCIYIISSKNRDAVSDAVDDLDFTTIDSNYSATYFPWIQVRDVENQAQVIIPPTGEVLRNIALTDNVAYPWFAPAGYNRGLVNAVKAITKLNNDDRDDLYKSRINPIATFADVGPVIWGQKTLQVHESPLDRVNVRRLLLQARKLISAVAIRLIFDQNDDVAKNEFEKLVNPILTNIKNERGLTDFKVVVSQTPEEMDRNTMSGKIFIKPTTSLEYITVNFVVTPQGASFENV